MVFVLPGVSLGMDDLETDSGMPPVNAPALNRDGPIQDQLTVAIVQCPPLFLDLAASTARAVEIIVEAGRDGAELIVFPETWLPDYPVWVDEADDVARWEHPGADALFAHLFANSARIEGTACYGEYLGQVKEA